MLAKIWKKLFLIICIIACLFNVTSKLVDQKSLEHQLESVKDGKSLSEYFNFTDTTEASIDGEDTVVKENEDSTNIIEDNTLTDNHIVVEY